MGLPNFIIAGETKCGTTSLYNMLTQHPNVLPAQKAGYNTVTEDGEDLAIKEVRFFDRYWAKGVRWYESCFPECPPGTITGEGTPMYLYRAQALQRMASVVPDAKIIIMLRNPVDRLVSHYHHLGRILPGWYERYPTMEYFWEEALEGDYYIIDKGIYWRSLEMLFSHFGRRQTYIMKSEDMFSDPQDEYNKLLDFLKLDQIILKDIPHSRKNTYNPINKELHWRIGVFYAGYDYKLKELTGRRFGWKYFSQNQT